MKKIFLLTFFFVTLFAGNLLAQQWTKMVYSGMHQFGPSENRFWFEYTLKNNGEGHLVFFNENSKDTLKYDVNADNSQIALCDSVFAQIITLKDKAPGRYRLRMRNRGDKDMRGMTLNSAIIEYTDDDGTMSKKWCNALMVEPVINNLNLGYWIDKARGVH